MKPYVNRHDPTDTVHAIVFNWTTRKKIIEMLDNDGVAWKPGYCAPGGMTPLTGRIPALEVYAPDEKRHFVICQIQMLVCGAHGWYGMDCDSFNSVYVEDSAGNGVK